MSERKDHLISATDAALVLGLTRQALYYIERTRQLRRLKRRGTVCYRTEDVMRLCAQRALRVGPRAGRPTAATTLARRMAAIREYAVKNDTNITEHESLRPVLGGGGPGEEAGAPLSEASRRPPRSSSKTSEQESRA